MTPDVVYFVTDDVDVATDELRFSLRSLDNIDHGKVWLIGAKPGWVVNVNHVPFPPHPKGKWFELAAKWFALRDVPTAESVIVLADDVYVTKPVTLSGPMFQGTLRDRFNHLKGQGRSGEYTQGFGNVLDVFPSGLNFDLHVPMVADKVDVPWHLFDQSHFPVATFSLVGNATNREPVRVEADWKVTSPADLDRFIESCCPFVSSQNATFESSGMARFLNDLFPVPSLFEGDRG